jgi:multiphosphoryl transfer protein
MKQLDLVIRNKTGLHARPARVFVDIAKQFQSTIRIGHGQKQVNAKSLISVLTLGVASGQRISIDVDGADEAAAIAALEAAVWSGLGEELVVLEEHQEPRTKNQEPRTGEPENQEPENSEQSPISNLQSPISTATDNGQRTTDNVVHGVAGAPGMAIGPIFQFRRAAIVVQARAVGVLEELTRLQSALAEAREQLKALHEQVSLRTGAAEAAIFYVHLEILEDPDLLDRVRAQITDQCSAAEAWQLAIDERATQLAGLSDALLAERATDVRDVGERVLRVMVGDATLAPALPEQPFILVANDLTPSETAALDPARVLGFCTAVGGPHAHTAILARALGLPAVVSAGARVLDLPNQTPVVLDGQNGTLTIAPDAAEITRARAEMEAFQARRAAAAAASGDPAITLDGHRVEIVANIASVEDARRAAASGAEGVGLLRTEFLFLERTEAPTEEEQFAIYRDIAQALDGRPIIVRTLDIGGDKPLPYLDLPHEENPFLGERGIRLCLAHPDLLQQQLRAILRAAEFGPLRIMFPMIADIAEVRAARAMVNQLRAELHAPAIEIGIMVEVPSAAVMADRLAHEVDFFSIGTNDLTQYTLAIDRTHPKLALQADGLHPAVLRLIERTVQGAHAAGKWVGVCGELGSDPLAVPILVGLGVDELSISVPAIPLVKDQIRSLTLAECRERADQALACASASQVRQAAMNS